MKNLFILLLFSFFCFFSGFSWSAACCGSGFVVPSIITSDDKAQISLNVSRSEISDDVFTNKTWQKREEIDQTTIYRMDAAHIFKDRFQLGLSLPFHTRERTGAQSEDSSGLGDTSLQLGYEFLPDWSYHPIRPKGIGYLGLIVPTGKSIYESQDGSGIDARGRGFWAVSTGAIFTKKWKKLDFNSNTEIHYSLPKKVSNEFLDATIKPSFGGNFSLGGGINFKDLRLGSLVNYNYESPVKVEGSTNSKGNLKRYTTLGLLVSYMISAGDSLTFNYSDQTLLGSPYNTSLSQSFSVLFQRRFSR